MCFHRGVLEVEHTVCLVTMTRATCHVIKVAEHSGGPAFLIAKHIVVLYTQAHVHSYRHARTYARTHSLTHINIHEHKGTCTQTRAFIT